MTHEKLNEKLSKSCWLFTAIFYLFGHEPISVGTWKDVRMIPKLGKALFYKMLIT
jgi:hypothetical protein